MPSSDKYKESRLRWDRENMTVLGCRVTKAKAAEFKDSCHALGVVPNQVLKQAIEDTITQAKELGDR